MKIQYRRQKFQADAAKAVVDVFAGQPYLIPTYRMDRGSGNYQISVTEERDFTGFSNQRIVPELSDQRILEQLNKIQRLHQIDREVKSIIDGCYAKAREIILEKEKVLHSCAQLLLEKEKIGREEFEALFVSGESTSAYEELNSPVFT